jgi:DNA sulfur modification protein DndC
VINNSSDNIVLLGIRRGESIERDKTIVKHETENDFYFRQSNNPRTLIYAPIVNYSVEDVWATVAYNDLPNSIDAKGLMDLYRQASGECPIIRDPKGTPCGCTVVRKDKSVQSLVDLGYPALRPLLEFRNWLIEIRDDKNYRSMKRRNGTIGLGPFTLSARRQILQKLLDAQQVSGYELISQAELDYIDQCWLEDKNEY